MELAAIIPLPAGRYRHRRVRCSGSDLELGLAFLFDPDPDPLVHGGEPSMQRWVQDQDFDTLEEAREAALRQDVPAPLEGWRDEVAFRSWVKEPEFALLIRPEAQRVGVLGRVLVGAGSLTAFVAVWVAFALLDPSLFREEGDELVYSIILVAIPALLVAAVVGAKLEEILSRRHLAREIARRGPPDGVPGYAPREPGPRSRGQAASPFRMARLLITCWMWGSLTPRRTLRTPSPLGTIEAAGLASLLTG